MISGERGRTNAAARSLRRRVVYRARQFAGYLSLPQAGQAAVDAELERLLTPAEWRLLARLTPADRRHAIDVRQRLAASGWTDPDLLRAALLHDVGKADCRGRVYLAHRVARVLLAAIMPRLLDRLASHGEGFWRHGLFLSVHHPRLGAIMTRKAGASERVCWLIAHHDDGTIHDDPALLALRQADEG